MRNFTDCLLSHRAYSAASRTDGSGIRTVWPFRSAKFELSTFQSFSLLATSLRSSALSNSESRA